MSRYIDVDEFIEDLGFENTDEEIIAHLKCCAETHNCKGCVYSKHCDGEEHLINALDLINRQKAEIERLKGSTIVNNIMKSQKIKRDAKSEAYKEFAERLKEEIRLDDDCDYNCRDCCYECNDYVIAIDNLLKEMGGEEE